jgi:hypothetical protein
MSKSNAIILAEHNLLFCNVAAANIGNAGGLQPSTVAGSFYLALHTADPGKAGDQSTNEVAYPGYARVAVARQSGAGGFVPSGVQVTLGAQKEFPQATSGANTTALFWSLGTAASGAGTIIRSGPFGSNLGAFQGATNDNITIAGLTGLAVNDRIVFFARPGDALPTGIVTSTVYFVKTVASDVITVSATQGGAAIDITTVGEGVAYRVVPMPIVETIVPTITTGLAIISD